LDAESLKSVAWLAVWGGLLFALIGEPPFFVPFLALSPATPAGLLCFWGSLYRSQRVGIGASATPRVRSHFHADSRLNIAEYRVLPIAIHHPRRITTLSDVSVLLGETHQSLKDLTPIEFKARYHSIYQGAALQL